MYVLGEPKVKCEYCGGEVIDGDEVYETDEGFVHDECFYDYCKKYAFESGWKQYAYGEDGQ